MKILAITQARTGSTRLPNKVLKEIAGKSLLQIHLERVRKSSLITKIIVATTTSPEDIKICDVAEKLGIEWYRGSEDDVLDRFYQASKNYNPDYVVRVTSDCPLLDPELIDSVISLIFDSQADYCSNVLIESFPDGQDVEVFTSKALEKAWKEALLRSEREHVTPYIYKNADFKGGRIFKALNYSTGEKKGHIRLTVDEPVDFEIVKVLVENLGTERSWKDYVKYLSDHNIDKNTYIKRNEGYTKSLNKDNNEPTI